MPETPEEELPYQDLQMNKPSTGLWKGKPSVGETPRVIPMFSLSSNMAIGDSPDLNFPFFFF